MLRYKHTILTQMILTHAHTHTHHQASSERRVTANRCEVGAMWISLQFALNSTEILLNLNYYVVRSDCNNKRCIFLILFFSLKTVYILCSNSLMSLGDFHKKFIIIPTQSGCFSFQLAFQASSRLNTCNKVQCFDISESQFKVGWCKQKCRLW